MIVRYASISSKIDEILAMPQPGPSSRFDYTVHTDGVWKIVECRMTDVLVEVRNVATYHLGASVIVRLIDSRIELGNLLMDRYITFREQKVIDIMNAVNRQLALLHQLLPMLRVASEANPVPE